MEAFGIDTPSHRRDRCDRSSHRVPLARSCPFLTLAAFTVASGTSLLATEARAQTKTLIPITQTPTIVAPTTPVINKPIVVVPDVSTTQLAKIMGTTLAVAQRIQSIDADRDTWTPAQRKLSSDFIYAARMAAGKPAAPGVQTLQTLVVPDALGRVNVVIHTSVLPNQNGLLTTAGRAALSTLQDAVAAAGGDILSNNATEILALVPLANVETLAAQDTIQTIRVYFPPRTIGRTSGYSGKPFKPRALVPYLHKKKTTAEMRSMLATAFTRAGIPFDNFSLSGLLLNAADYNGTDTGVIGEGVTVHAVASAYNQFGVSGYNAALGRPIRIGVISDDDTYLVQSQNSLDLPATDSTTRGTGSTPSVSIVVDDTSGSQVAQTGTAYTSTGEGTAMMQIVHDMMPNAKIFFATANPTETQFAKNVLLLRYKYNCDIICDDIAFANEQVFSDGIEAQAVNQVTANGCFYFSSAGNEGHISTYSLPNTNVSGVKTASVWEGDFVDGGPVTKIGTTTVTGNVHAFAPGVNYNTANNPAPGKHTSTGYIALLEWSDPDQGTGNEYNLYAVTASTTAAGTTFSGTSAEPYQYVAISPGAQLYILKKSGTARALHLTTMGFNPSAGFGPSMTYTTNGQTGGHNTAPNAFGVAAAPAINTSSYPYGGPYPNAFNSSSPSEYFSSDGPRTVFYTVSGGPNIALATNPYGLPVSSPTFTMIGSAPTFASGGAVRLEPFIEAADAVSSSAVFVSDAAPTYGSFNPFFGTSAASPHAASIAGLIMSYSSSNVPTTPGLAINGALLSQADMHTIFSSTAIDTEAPGYDATTGYGIVMPTPALQFLVGFLYNNTIFAVPTDTSATITWNTLLPANTVVNYGPTPALGGTATNSTATTSHNITLTGLTPGTTYYYIVTTATATGSATYTDPTARTFTTAAATPPSLTLTAASVTTSGGVSTATITLVNNGGAASAVTVTSATLAGNNTTTKLPDNLGSLAANASQQFTLTFPAIASGRNTLKLSVTDGTGAIDNFSVKVTAP